ncbi:uncharacterized protein SPSK_05930 [Sporothrix schenckii 1099-18]|uniref:Bactericidal permeability-increasing protein n=1 Tax=Sporothrix schenckii 1099-18 TaxID=1397361 RepID=A0A0F2MJL5_SPOSC|nr:uncharacterized protein SPSK_05930 [Sporothrix schenckii 1099-18]KJR89898.1 hypothetical protein SPSK_05930 [Sporothrix schenckii 1099-18]
MASTGVNRPTNVRQRDEDIDRKLQLYGIASAFRNGKMPSNEQIDATLNSFIASKALSNPSNKLSSEGRALVADFRDVVNQAKLLLLTKNDGNLLQDFIWKTSRHEYSSIEVPGAVVSKDEAKQDGDKALEGIKTLGNLLITNGQFRKLLKDSSVLFRDILADSASKATSVVRPSDEALAQIDEPAPDDTWHDRPNLAKNDLKNRTKALYKKNNSGGTTSGRDVGGTSATDTQRLDGLQDGTAETVQDKTAEYRDRAKAYLRSKVPQERRDQAVWRLKKMIIECQQHPDYQQAIQALLDLAERYHSHAKTTTANSHGVVQNTRDRLSDAEADLKTLIERFANSTSTDNLWSSINDIYTLADNDNELQSWFSKVDRFLRRCLQEKGFVLEDASTEEWNRLYDHGNYLLREKYRPQTDKVANEVKFLADQFDKDAQNQAFGKSVRKLLYDLGNDENGKQTFKPHLVKDVTNVILPATLESIAYIPIPRIEYSDSQVDAVIENLVLESDNFMPNVFEIYNNNYVSWGRKLGKVGNNRHSAQVNVSGIQMDLRNVSYYVKRKEGFPSLTDVGIFSVFLSGQGFSFKLGLSTAGPSNRQHFFKVDKVHVDIDNLKITMHKSQHKLLFTVFKPILMRVMRPVLQKVLEKTIRDNFNKWDTTLYTIKQDADRAGRELDVDPDEAGSKPNSYNRFFTAARKHMEDSKERKKVEAKKKAADLDDKKLNIAYTKEDSIFPHINLPGGFSSKASRYRAMANEGDNWQSPVFTLGSAGTTKSVPKPSVIEKKEAPVSNPSRVNGANGANRANGNDDFATANSANGYQSTQGHQSTQGLQGANGLTAPLAVPVAVVAPAGSTATATGHDVAVAATGAARDGAQGTTGVVSSVSGRLV